MKVQAAVVFLSNLKIKALTIPELFQECIEAAKRQDAIGYYVAEQVMFMGKWIRHSTQYPRYQMRLFQKGKVWFTDYGYTEREVCNLKVQEMKQIQVSDNAKVNSIAATTEATKHLVPLRGRSQKSKVKKLYSKLVSLF